MNSQDLLDLATKTANQASSGEDIEVALARSVSTNVRVHEAAVESLTNSTSDAVGVRVVMDNKQGFASTGTLTEAALKEALDQARQNAACAEADEYVAIAEKVEAPVVEIESWDPSVLEVETKSKIEFALDLERRALAADARIVGARTTSYTDGYSYSALASSKGVSSADRATYAGAAIQVLASDGSETKSGYGFDGGKNVSEIELGKILDRSVNRALSMLGSVKPSSQPVALFLDSDNADTFLGLVAAMLNGEAMVKGRTPFASRVGEQIASKELTLFDDPTDSTSSSAVSFDGEGMPTKKVGLIGAGVLEGFYHDSYTAKRSGELRTGSAVRSARSLPSPGVMALHAEAGGSSVAKSFEDIKSGLYVYDFAGLHSGVNLISGDLSLGVEGRMIRNGELAESVNECTVTSTIQRMLLSISRIGASAESLYSGAVMPSLVIDDVPMAGV